MILLQKETEKLARVAFARISRERPSSRAENEVVLDWCLSSINTLLRVMPLSSIKSLSRRIKDHLRMGVSMAKDGSTTPLGDSYHDYEIVKQ
mmetsp:Transcript_17148/g.21645  ORF Transcript_17148/g.21645 Transcript_17148/m.21645 type:complete len:92 (+) Transcript_17148:451-726(+)